jgi:hypothetical protein
MTLKTLTLDLGTVSALQYSTGWYYDPNTGQRYYYNAAQNQWYVSLGGYLYALGYMNPAPKQVTVAPGDKLKIVLSFKYMGPAITGILSRWCIGVYGVWGFTEKVAITPTLDIPANASTTPITVTKEQVLTIPASPGTDWDDIYVKMWGGTPDLGGSEQSPAYIYGCENALIIAGANVVITDFKISDFAKV